MPDVPAETVTLEGETDKEKLLDELVVDPPQPERKKPSATRARVHETVRIRRKRQPTKAARSNPAEPKAGVVIGSIGLEEILEALELRKAWTLPLWTEAVEQFALPVMSVSVSLTALEPLIIAFEMS
jgi:hypothetical protein